MQLVTDFEGHDIHPHMDGHSMDIESKRGRYNLCLVGTLEDYQQFKERKLSTQCFVSLTV